MRQFRFSLYLAIWIPLILFSSAHVFAQDRRYAIINVNVITMTPDNQVFKNATVTIEGNEIAGINQSIPRHTKIIDAKGKWLMPGLIDMHVHNLADINLSQKYPTKGATLFTDNQDFMLLYVANGVTTCFELNARPEHFGQRNEIIRGKVIGPRVALAFLIDGAEGSGNNAHTGAEGRQTVRIAKAQGYEFIKVYSALNLETFQAITDEAAKLGMKVVGHIPNVFRGHLKDAFVPNFGMVAHAEEFSKQTRTYSDEDARQFARLAKANGTWLAPTLTTMVRIAQQTHTLDSIKAMASLKYVHPLMQNKWLTANAYHAETSPAGITRIDSMVNFHYRLVRAFKEAQVPMVAGTDAGVSGLVWGYALHDELKELVKAGLSNAETIAAATRLPAEWLGIADKVGTVQKGKFADLILLHGNPLENIGNMEKISAVCFNGRWIAKKQIDHMLSDLARKNKANLGTARFDWKNRANY